MRLHSWLVLIFVLAPVSLLSGCALFRTSTLPDLDTYIPLDATRRAEVQSHFLEQAAAHKKFRVLANVEAISTLGSERFKQAIAFERPGKLRVDFFGSSLNKLIGTIIKNETSLVVLDALTRRAYAGPYQDSAVESLIGLPIDAQELSLLFVGVHPFLSSDTSLESEFYLSPDAREMLVLSRLSAGVLAYSTSACESFEQCEQPTLKRVQLFSNEGLMLADVVYARGEGGLSGFSLAYPQESVSFVFDYEHPEFQADGIVFDTRVFQGRVPRSYERVALGELTFLGR